ncbi:MAG TPA: glycosyltransferase [Vicinamibacteria bacterium]|nr:glycosyltransferase [Vicinamibacteria bacterium]
MKLLLLVSDLSAGGIQRQFVELLKGLRGKSICPRVVLFSREVHYDDIERLGVKTYFLERRIKKDPTVFLKLYKICKEFRPDIIHSWDSMSSIYAVPSAKLLKIKFINFMIQDAPQPAAVSFSESIRSKLTFPFSDMILANSRAGLRSYNAPPERSRFVHNGFDLTRVNRVSETNGVRSRFAIETPHVVGMVARFHIGKDYESYIASATRILERRDDVTFLAVGDGSTLAECRQRVSSTFGDRIKFLGNQRDVESIVNIFDVGVLLTNPNFHGEGISNSIMEYMALGKPVVATRGGGTAEIVDDGKTGFVVEPRNVEAIAERIELLLDDPELADSMGVAGKERLFNNFGLTKMMESFVELYEEILCARN